MKEQIQEIVKQIESKHQEDPSINTDLDKITELLGRSISEAIGTIQNLDENSISWISSSFEELSVKFKSQDFIICIKELVNKFPNIPYLKDDVENAIKVF